MPTHTRKTILLATDQQRSVLNALDSNRPQPIAYTPYGHRPPESGLLSLLGFNGELPDQVSGHYLLGNGYRAFNPVLMRFNSPDSWSPFGKGGLNSYAYCEGEPVLRSDPTGHSHILRSFWKGIKNIFGRKQKKLQKRIDQFNSAFPPPLRPGRTKSLDLTTHFPKTPKPDAKLENLFNSPNNNPQDGRLVNNLAGDRKDRHLSYLAASRSEMSFPPDAKTRKTVNTGISNSEIRKGL